MTLRYAAGRGRMQSSGRKYSSAARQRRREAILCSAEKIFSRHGIDAATVEEVARDARVSRALVHLYFGSKSGLITALCARELRRLHGRFAAIVERHASALDGIEAIAHAYAAFSRESPVGFRAIAHSRVLVPMPGAAASSIKDRAASAAANDVHQLVRSLLRRGTADGSIRADFGNTELLAAIFWGFMLGVTRFGNMSMRRLAHAGLNERDLTVGLIKMLRPALAPQLAGSR